jgi:hypothetical protein
VALEQLLQHRDGHVRVDAVRRPVEHRVRAGIIDACVEVLSTANR